MLGVYDRLKPPDPIWQPGSAPAGCKIYLPLAERTGTVARDLSGNKNHGTLTNGPAWQTGAMGPQVGGFAANKFIKIASAPAIIGTYPFWFASLAIKPGIIDGFTWANLFAVGGAPQILLRWSAQGVSGRLAYTIRDGTVAADVTANGTAINDGLPHAAMIASFAANDHRLYLDGSQVGSSSVAVSLPAFDWLGLGSYTSGLYFDGAILAAACGNGAVPDPMRLAQDWLGGRFAAVRPKRRALLFAAGVQARLSVASIPTAESFGSASLAASTTVTTTAIPSAEAFGTITTATSTTVTTTSIPSAESFGAVNVGSGVTLAVATIPSAESFGSMSLATATTIAIDAIPSAEAFGDVSAEATTTIAAAAIPSEESFGSVLVFGAVPSSLYPVAGRLPGQPDPKRTKIKYL